MIALVACSIPWDSYGRLGGVTRPLGPMRTPLGRGTSPAPRMAAVATWPNPWAPYSCRGVWPVPSVPYGRCAGVALPLGPV